MRALLELDQLADDPKDPASSSPTNLQLVESQYISVMLEHIGEASSITEVRSLFCQFKRDGIPLKFLNPNHCFVDGYSIEIGLEVLSSAEERNLEKIKSLRISAAPTLVLHKSFKSRESVTVLYYPFCHLHPPRTALGTGISISQEARARLSVDLIRLSKIGLYHPLVLRDRSQWLLSNSGNCIFIKNWGCLRRISTLEQIEIVQSIQRQILK